MGVLPNGNKQPEQLRLLSPTSSSLTRASGLSWASSFSLKRQVAPARCSPLTCRLPPGRAGLARSGQHGRLWLHSR